LMPILMEFGTFMADTVVPIIADVVESLSGWITSMQETGTTSGVFDTIRNAIAGIPGVLDTLSTGLATVLVFLQPLTDAITTFGTVFVTAMTSAGGAISEYLASPTMQGYLATLQTALGALATLVRDVLVLAFQGLTIAWQLLSDGFTIAWPYIKIVLDAFYSLITIGMATTTGILTALSQLVKGDFQGAWTTLKTTLDTTIKDITGFFTTLETKVKGVLNEVMGKFTEVGTNIATGIANGITDAAGKIADAAKGAASRAYEAAKDFLGMESPSKLMRDKVGLNFSKGMALGILDGIPDVVSASRDTAAIAAETGASTINNFTFSASYANTQNESSLIADARAWMMTMGSV